MRHAVRDNACDSSATDISILQDTTRLHIDNKSKATCFLVLVVPAHTLLCVEKFSHSLQETEVVKEADEHVRFAVPQAVPSPVYRNACHGHVSLYVMLDDALLPIQCWTTLFRVQEAHATAATQGG